MEELAVLKDSQGEEQRSFWEKKFLEYDTHYADMSYKAFCKAQSLNYGQLKYWRQRLNHQKIRIQSSQVPKAEKKISFIPVEIKSSEYAEKPLVIELYYGEHYRFVLPLNIEKTRLVSLLKALEESHAHAAIRD